MWAKHTVGTHLFTNKFSQILWRSNFEESVTSELDRLLTLRSVWKPFFITNIQLLGIKKLCHPRIKNIQFVWMRSLKPLDLDLKMIYFMWISFLHKWVLKRFTSFKERWLQNAQIVFLKGRFQISLLPLQFLVSQLCNFLCNIPCLFGGCFAPK